MHNLRRLNKPIEIMIDRVVARLRTRFTDIRALGARPLVYRLGGKKANIRTATTKSGDKYWFDFLLYTCGDADSIYVFPVRDFASLIEGASLGGQKQVPNFTIYLDRHLFEPAGRADAPRDISGYFNRFDLIGPAA
jgi:hypothetical protein